RTNSLSHPIANHTSRASLGIYRGPRRAQSLGEAGPRLAGSAAHRGSQGGPTTADQATGSVTMTSEGLCWSNDSCAEHRAIAEVLPRKSGFKISRWISSKHLRPDNRGYVGYRRR